MSTLPDPYSTNPDRSGLNQIKIDISILQASRTSFLYCKRNTIDSREIFMAYYPHILYTIEIKSNITNWWKSTLGSKPPARNRPSFSLNFNNGTRSIFFWYSFFLLSLLADTCKFIVLLSFPDSGCNDSKSMREWGMAISWGSMHVCLYPSQVSYNLTIKYKRTC